MRRHSPEPIPLVREGLNQAIPIIAVTASSDLRDRLLAAGYDEFIAKPVDPFRLCDRIHEVIQRPSSSGRR